MMREFGRPEETPPLEETPENIPLEDVNSAALRPLPVQDEEGSGHGTATIVVGVVIGALVVGGAFYAYKISTADMPPQQVALKTPAVNHVANDQIPEPVPPVPPPETNPAPAPAPSATPPLGPPITAARNGARSRSPRDDAINAPMTLTPENAPPPQQATPPLAANHGVAQSMDTRQQPADPARAPTEQAQIPAVEAQQPAAQ